MWMLFWEDLYSQKLIFRERSVGLVFYLDYVTYFSELTLYLQWTWIQGWRKASRLQTSHSYVALKLILNYVSQWTRNSIFETEILGMMLVINLLVHSYSKGSIIN